MGNMIQTHHWNWRAKQHNQQSPFQLRSKKNNFPLSY